MITYTHSNDKNHAEKIKHTLRSHNQQFTGTVEPEAIYLYALKNESLVGALKVGYFWDWATIGAVYYDSIPVLAALIARAWKHYEHRAVGIKFFAPIKARFDDFIQAGFTHTTTIKNLGTRDFYHAVLREIKPSSNHYRIVLSDKALADYQVVLDEKTRVFNQTHNLNERLDTIQIVALEGNNFMGGVQGDVYDDALCITRLATLVNHRHKGIGRTLMKKAIDEARKRNLPVVELGTIDFQAKGFYEKLGFHVVHTINDNPRGYNAYTMIKRL